MTVHIDPSWSATDRIRAALRLGREQKRRAKVLRTVRNWAAWILAGSFIAWLVTR